MGAEAVDGGRALDGVADGLGHLGHDLDGLGALVVAALAAYLDDALVGVAASAMALPENTCFTYIPPFYYFIRTPRRCQH